MSEKKDAADRRLRDNLAYAQARADETGRAYLIHGWVDDDGDRHAKVVADLPGNRRMIKSNHETIFKIVRPRARKSTTPPSRSRSTSPAARDRTGRDPQGAARLQSELLYAREDYKFWARQEHRLTRDEYAQKMAAERRVRELEAAIRKSSLRRSA